MTRNLLLTILGILLAIFTICNVDMRSPVSIIEGWTGMDGMRSMAVAQVIQDPITGIQTSAGPSLSIDPVSCGGPIGGGTDRATKEKFGDINSFYTSGPSPYVNPFGQKMNVPKVSGSMVPQQIPQGSEPNPLMGSGQFFQAPPYFQSNIAPRFDNSGSTPFIRYNLPDQANLGSPCDPLDADRTVGRENYKNIRENYDDNGSNTTSAPSCGKGGYGFTSNLAGGYEVPSGYANGNKNQVYDSLPGVVVSNACSDKSSGDVPTGSLTLTDDAGHPVQYLTFDRYMFTTKKSKLWGLADLIRGDLAITPNYHGNFDVFPTVGSDVCHGAIHVMSGNENKEMNQLIKRATGHSIPSSVPMANQVGSNVGPNCTDLEFTAFP